jgi:hypothetical protein
LFIVLTQLSGKLCSIHGFTEITGCNNGIHATVKIGRVDPVSVIAKIGSVDLEVRCPRSPGSGNASIGCDIRIAFSEVVRLSIEDYPCLKLTLDFIPNISL